ncbi:glycosyltransferase family 4 protein [Chitinophaga rhizophila]|uniref:Glycosyltransferase family 4 protein n=1 Tax=Chitinophaga rhizophila TaxID=2866212 RepID=A0ABS7GI34_9BACT|nr:glycosyltransferase family 4 protein [Chitinophaga rhizophila]MBW8687354.1 glycosyltransferase family 4 protein [Chitinophaga rhizophila]
MRIVHLCNYFQPKLGYQEYFLSNEHSKMGHEVTVVTSERYFPFPDYDNTVFPVLGKRIGDPGEFDYEGFRVIKLDIAFEFSKRVWLRGLTRVLKRIQPDVVICHGIGNFNALRAAKLKGRLGFRLVVDDHMLISEKNHSLLGQLYYKAFNFRNIYEKADRIVGVADECVEYIVDQYKFPRSRVEMIPLGADIDLFRFNKQLGEGFRRKHRIDPEAVVITYTGKHTFKKGPHNILMALEKLKDVLGDRKVTALFIGNMENAYEQTFNDHVGRVTDKIQVVRIAAVTNKELVDIYSASDIAVWPRQGSMSMIEASSCEVAIVCCDFLTERYKNNNGIPIKEDDIDDLAKAFDFLIRNDEERVAMGKRGRELIMNEMSWKIIAERFIK